ncbi:sulfite exporter TauE/SafE family protein [Paenibacillus turpanensis]|uniref:sulfite exporter TauE/SafE family protein n=1 Tax=Paenibacillus turpanensis TaxID=2689078 RepID=UPI001408A7F0|nr:sulfite exporter TauE/SafE family protein [Paenibacillus turpanensis]
MNCFHHQEQASEFECSQCKQHYCNECRDHFFSEYCTVCSEEKTKLYLRSHHKAEQNKQLWRNGLGWYQIISGLIGAAMMIIVFLFSIKISSFLSAVILILLFGIFFGLYLLVAAAGYFILKDKRHGRKLTVWVQALQIPSFSILGLSYKFIAGLSVSLGLQLVPNLNMGLNFYILNQFNLSFSNGHHQLFLSINIVPILILYFLYKNRTEYR